MVVVIVSEEEASAKMGADLEEEASAGGATAALDELAEVICGVVFFRALFEASDDGAAFMARAPLVERLVLVASVLVRVFLVAGPPVTLSSSTRRFGGLAIETTFAVFFGFSRRTRLDGSTTSFTLGARLREGGAV